MKKMIYLLMLLSIYFKTNAQIVDSCGTPDADSAFLTTLPWFGNNAFLTNFRDSLHNANSCNNCRVGYVGGVNNYIYQIPVRVIIYYDNTHRALDDDEVQWYINEVNRIYQFNRMKIQIYLDCAIYRDYNTVKAVANWADMWATSMSPDRHFNKLNLHIVHAGGNVNIANGIGPYPWLQDKYGSAVTANGQAGNEAVAKAMAHEIAHTVGVLHTFHKNKHNRTNCFQESVSRTQTQEGYCFFTAGKKKCEVNGDCLCDTHADIMDLAKFGYDGEFANCANLTYDISSRNTLSNSRKFDNYGEQWYKPGTWFGVPFANAMYNLMSYWDNECIDSLTPMQQAVMYHYINKANTVFKYNADVDFYENDNFYQRNPFAFGSNCNIYIPNSTKQYHAFHLVQTISYPINSTTACDVDWVYFQNNTSTAKPYVIQTQEVTGKPKPDTKITLFAINGDGTLGAQIATNVSS